MERTDGKSVPRNSWLAGAAGGMPRRQNCPSLYRVALVGLLAALSSISAGDDGAALSSSGKTSLQCGWESDDGAVTELVVEVFSDPESSSSHILGYGPAEVSGALQHITAYFTAVDLETIKTLTLKAWANCLPIGGPMACEQLMTSGSEQSGELFVYAINAWKGGHDNHVILQLFNDDGQLLAQGTTSFRLEAITNKTEGLLHSLANVHARSGVTTQQHDKTCTEKSIQTGSACGEESFSAPDIDAYSSVKALEWDELVCSQPRAPLRVYQVSMAQWTRGQLHLWLPHKTIHAVGVSPDGDSGAGGVLSEEGVQVGMLRMVGSRLPPSAGCHPLHSWQGGAHVVALLPVGVTAGSIEHLGHFFLDYLANVYRMQAAYLHAAGRRAATVEWLCLVDDMRASLDDLPPRKFYPLLAAVCQQPWRSLGELPEKTCLPEVVTAFGGLETIRSRDAWGVPASVHTDMCRAQVWPR
jgi:hypothetical protein